MLMMMRRPEFLMMRRPCAAMRCHRKNPGRTASILLLPERRSMPLIGSVINMIVTTSTGQIVPSICCYLELIRISYHRVEDYVQVS
jgi:hypothetical protein